MACGGPETYVRVEDVKDIQIRNFSVVDQCKATSTYFLLREEPFLQVVCVSVYPNGISSETHGWISVQFHKVLKDPISYPFADEDHLSWTLSVVDVNGDAAYYQSFCKDNVLHSPYNMVEPNFLKRSSLLERSDELLPGDVLTVRCELSCICYPCPSIDRKTFIQIRVLKDNGPGAYENASQSAEGVIKVDGIKIIELDIGKLVSNVLNTLTVIFSCRISSADSSVSDFLRSEMEENDAIDEIIRTYLRSHSVFRMYVRLKEKLKKELDRRPEFLEQDMLHFRKLMAMPLSQKREQLFKMLGVELRPSSLSPELTCSAIRKEGGRTVVEEQFVLVSDEKWTQEEGDEDESKNSKRQDKVFGDYANACPLKGEKDGTKSRFTGFQIFAEEQWQIGSNGHEKLRVSNVEKRQPGDYKYENFCTIRATVQKIQVPVKLDRQQPHKDTHRNLIPVEVAEKRQSRDHKDENVNILKVNQIPEKSEGLQPQKDAYQNLIPSEAVEKRQPIDNKAENLNTLKVNQVPSKSEGQQPQRGAHGNLIPVKAVEKRQSRDHKDEKANILNLNQIPVKSKGLQPQKGAQKNLIPVEAVKKRQLRDKKDENVTILKVNQIPVKSEGQQILSANLTTKGQQSQKEAHENLIPSEAVEKIQPIDNKDENVTIFKVNQIPVKSEGQQILRENLTTKGNVVRAKEEEECLLEDNQNVKFFNKELVYLKTEMDYESEDYKQERNYIKELSNTCCRMKTSRKLMSFLTL